jgi:protein-L-isoaspartate(D-aspartate) O-methyltransferase
VVSVEIDAATADQARRTLQQAGFANVRVEQGDGARGWGDEAFDAIVLTGSTPLLPERFIEQLRPGGRVFAVMGEPPVMTARLTRYTGPGSRVSKDLFETVIQPLRNALGPDRFVF